MGLIKEIKKEIDDFKEWKRQLKMYTDQKIMESEAARHNMKVYNDWEIKKIKEENEKTINKAKNIREELNKIYAGKEDAKDIKDILKEIEA